MTVNIGPRALQILKLIADGKQRAEIAQEIGISVDTVHKHTQALRQKRFIKWNWADRDWKILTNLIELKPTLPKPPKPPKPLKNTARRIILRTLAQRGAMLSEDLVPPVMEAGYTEAAARVALQRMLKGGELLFELQHSTHGRRPYLYSLNPDCGTLGMSRAPWAKNRNRELAGGR